MTGRHRAPEPPPARLPWSTPHLFIAWGVAVGILAPPVALVAERTAAKVVPQAVETPEPAHAGVEDRFSRLVRPTIAPESVPHYEPESDAPTEAASRLERRAPAPTPVGVAPAPTVVTEPEPDAPPPDPEPTEEPAVETPTEEPTEPEVIIDDVLDPTPTESAPTEPEPTPETAPAP